MRVGTNKPVYTMFRSSQNKSTEYLKSRYRRQLQVFNYFCVRTEDFITADIPGGHFMFLATPKGKTPRTKVTAVAQEHSIEKRLERLEDRFNDLVRSTWSYLFTEKDIKEMGKLSESMLEDSKKMRELAQKLKDTDDEG